MKHGAVCLESPFILKTRKKIASEYSGFVPLSNVVEIFSMIFFCDSLVPGNMMMILGPDPFHRSNSS